MFRRTMTLLLLLAFETHAAPMTSLLMVGNSFVDANDLEYMVEQMLREGNTKKEVYAMRFDQGSSRFAEHVQEPDLKAMMLERSWDWVILQEQSEIPAFGGTYYEPTFDLSLKSLETLDAWIREAQSDTVLFMTWARAGADPYYPDLFPNFEHMQTKVKEGYLRMQQAISTPERPVPIVPAGLAFQYIREQDPTSSNGTDFAALYAEDTIHPSVLGSYLAACTIYAALAPVGSPAVTHLQFGPPGLKTGIKHYLQEVAQAVAIQFNNENPINRQYTEMKRADNKKPYHPVSPNNDNSSPSSSSSSPPTTPSSWNRTMSVLVLAFVVLIGAMNLWMCIQQKRLIATYSGRHPVPSSQYYGDDDDDDDDLQLRDSLELPEIR